MTTITGKSPRRRWTRLGFPGAMAFLAVFTFATDISAQQSDRAAQAAPASPPPAPSAESDAAAKKALQTESGKTGTAEPNVETPAAQQPAPGVLVNGRLAVPGAPEDSETVPAKFSARNAALDELPIMAQPLHLTADQKQRIWDFVSKTEVSRTAIDARPAQQLPPAVELREFASDLPRTIPAIAGYEYVRLPDKVLLVQAPNRIVVGEVARPDGSAGQRQ